MTPDELAPWAEKHPVAPDGWEPLSTLPIAKFRVPIEYLIEDGSTRRALGVTNLDFVCMKPPKAWRLASNINSVRSRLMAELKADIEGQIKRALLDNYYLASRPRSTAPYSFWLGADHG